MDHPKTLHEAFDFNCTRRTAEDGPALCVLCYAKMVRAAARIYQIVEAQ